jgi:BirA family biotin operon repressor/biotin-[acetyl-CoA-carboxylase] ligase
MIGNNPKPDDIAALLYREGEKVYAGINGREVARYGAFVGSVIESHRSLPRAMDHARSLIQSKARLHTSVASGTIILADTMNRSKGRFMRSWHAPLGGVWGCMIHGNTLLAQSRRFIPFAVGLSCCEALHKFGGEKARMRWVNDVLVDGMKIAGFLVEGFVEPAHGEEFTLVGFGININNNSFPSELTASAISLRQVTGRTVDITEFTTSFLGRLAWNFGLLYHEEAKELRGEIFSGPGGKHHLVQRWRECSDSVGKKVIYGFDVMNAPQYRARVAAVDDEGGLVLRMEDGHLKTEYAGEIRYLHESFRG